MAEPAFERPADQDVSTLAAPASFVAPNFHSDITGPTADYLAKQDGYVRQFGFSSASTILINGESHPEPHFEPHFEPHRSEVAPKNNAESTTPRSEERLEPRDKDRPEFEGPPPSQNGDPVPQQEITKDADDEFTGEEETLEDGTIVGTYTNKAGDRLHEVLNPDGSGRAVLRAVDGTRTEVLQNADGSYTITVTSPDGRVRKVENDRRGNSAIETFDPKTGIRERIDRGPDGRLRTTRLTES